MSPLQLVILSVVLLVASAAADDETGQVTPLFADASVVAVTITAPFREIMRERSLEDEEAGTITYVDPEAGDVTLDIGIRTRGRYRHQKDVCPFAPLRINFRKTGGTLFAKSDKLKLVTHCKNRHDRYTQTVLREYLAYRILNTLTDRSFRARLLRVRYVESTTGEPIEDNYAFLIEHRDQLAKRLGHDYNPAEEASINALDAAHTNLVSLYQYLIGNTDFSPIAAAEDEPCCHNYVLFGAQPGTMLSIPYDFDITGIVAAPHATPNPRFRLRNVRQRLYRGRCANNAHMDASIARFMEQKQAIYALLDDIPDFSATSRKKTIGYIDDFYEVIESPKQVDRRLVRQCI